MAGTVTKIHTFFICSDKSATHTNALLSKVHPVSSVSFKLNLLKSGISISVTKETTSVVCVCVCGGGCNGNLLGMGTQ